MSVFKLPEGCEIDFKVYVVGGPGEELDGVVSLKGMTAFSSDIKPEMDLAQIVKTVGLNDKLPPDTSWRVMTRAEIKDYKQRELD